MQAKQLMREVATVMADVLVHQRPRWGTLLAHQRQYEGWWKAEMALALESWAWRADLQAHPMDVLPEAKPCDFGLDNAPPSADLLIAPVNGELNDFDYAKTPRVWLELKERGTWWGTKKGHAAKAFGTANSGLWSDLHKWKTVAGRSGEVVLACQITSHVGTYSDRLPDTWLKELEAIGAEYEHAIDPRCVGSELPGKDVVRWTRFDSFVISAG
jgi:hypothetical protein